MFSTAPAGKALIALRALSTGKGQRRPRASIKLASVSAVMVQAHPSLNAAGIAKLSVITLLKAASRPTQDSARNAEFKT
jgi:hypothetical protein